MALKRIFLPHQSRRQISEDFPREYDNNNNQAIDDTNEQSDYIESLTDLTTEQQHRDRRRSSLQIFNLKFLQTLSNQVDNKSNDPIYAADEDKRECE